MASLDINVRQANADFQAIKNKIVANGVEVAIDRHPCGYTYTETSEKAPESRWKNG